MVYGGDTNTTASQLFLEWASPLETYTYNKKELNVSAQDRDNKQPKGRL